VHLKELVCYIHLNSSRAKVLKDIKDLGKYRWYGHSALMGKAEAGLQDKEYVLKLFGQSIRQGRRAYESFVAKGVAQSRRPDLASSGLLRSVWGWAGLKEFRDIGVCNKGDEQLLGSPEYSFKFRPPDTL